MKNKNYLITVLALVFMMISSMAFAAPGTPTKYKGLSAIAAARTEVAAAANLLGYNKDGDNMIVVFQDPATLEHYFVKVVMETSKVKEVKITDSIIAGNGKMFLIAGPCVIESEELVMEVAGKMKEITDKFMP